MKAICFTGSRSFGIKDIPEPQIEDIGDVKIRVAYAGLCGDDMHVLRGDLGGFIGNQIMGDEMSGVVCDVGEGAYKAGFRVGDKVSGVTRSSCGKCIYCLSGQTNFCRNAEPMGVMCEYIVLQYTQLCKLPENVSLKTGALLPLVTLCSECIQKANLFLGGSLAIFGAGGIGLISLLLALRQGATNITVIEPVESKRILAKTLGANDVIDPMTQNVFAKAYKITGNIGYNSVLEASGSIAGFSNAMSVVAEAGTIVTPSIYHADFKYSLDVLDFLWRQITLTAVRSPSQLNLARMADLLGHLDLSIFTAHIFPFDMINNAYKAYTSGLYPKIMISIDAKD